MTILYYVLLDFDVKVFKQVGGNNYLFVIPDNKTWSISDKWNVDANQLKGGRANQSCPAHPRSSLNKKEGDANWKTDDGVKGGVLLRCATHDQVHSRWLAQHVRESKVGKEARERWGSYLCEEDIDGCCLLSLLDYDVQQEVARWNPDAVEKIAHKLSPEFVQWLITQAMEGKWDEEEVGSIVCRKNAENKLILSTLDKETQRKVAVFNMDKTCRLAVPHMEQDFLQWLHQEAAEGRWNQEMVSEAVVKKELDGKAHFSAIIKPGIVCM